MTPLLYILLGAALVVAAIVAWAWSTAERVVGGEIVRDEERKGN
jgi:hypothetical protein